MRARKKKKETWLSFFGFLVWNGKSKKRKDCMCTDMCACGFVFVWVSPNHLETFLGSICLRYELFLGKNCPWAGLFWVRGVWNTSSNIFGNTVECHYNAVQHDMNLLLAQRWLRQNMHQRLYSQQTPHISPSRASYGEPFVRIWVKIDHVLTAPHCTIVDGDPVMQGASTSAANILSEFARNIPGSTPEALIHKSVHT